MLKGDLLSKIEESLSRIDAREAQIEALLPEPNRRERLFREASALIERFPNEAIQPPLFGILVGVKDLFCVDGFETRAGSALPGDIFSGAESSVVTALRRAGALLLGKTVTTEFAYFEPGPTRNPLNIDHTPGGSSSGSAGAVAAGFCDVALGTQTIGSITRPASYCGVIGFKPSYGRVASDGVVPFSSSVDTVGFFARDVAAIESVSAVLCSQWRSHKIAKSESPLPRLGVPTGSYLEQANAECRAAFERQVERYVAAGYSVVSVPLFGAISELNLLHRQLVAAEFSEVHREWFARFGHLYRKGSRELFEFGLSVSADVLSKGRGNRTVLREKISKLAMDNGIDIWVSPSTVDAAPHGIGATGSPLMNLPWTHAGVPTISLPAGRSSLNLPFGVQLAAPFGADERLIGAAQQIASLAIMC